MAGYGSFASHIRQRIASILRSQTTWAPFMDPRAHSWAREVKRYAELPAQYRPFFQGIAAGPNDMLPYSVVTPTFRGAYGHPEPERLLCIREGAVQVLEATEGRLSCSSYAPGRIQMIEYGVLLLHSWITVRGWDDSGALQSLTIRFNSVSDYLMVPFVDHLRGPELDAPAALLEMERAKLDYLAASHYKFRTYGRASVRAGATVCQAIFQPEIRRKRIRVLGVSLTRLVSPAHLSLLSNSELIDIREDTSQRWSRGQPHGAIWTYLPRSSITGACLASRADEIQELSVQLQGGLSLQSLFEADRSPQLQEIIGALSC